MVLSPPAMPDRKDDGKPNVFVQRLRKICCGQMQASADPAARQRFSKLLDCVNNEALDLPHMNLMGRADHPTCTSVLVAKVVQAISMIRVHAAAKDLEPVVAEAERIVGRDYRIVGEPGVGWIADFEDKK